LEMRLKGRNFRREDAQMGSFAVVCPSFEASCGKLPQSILTSSNLFP
jgi:hypothetical protein